MVRGIRAGAGKGCQVNICQPWVNKRSRHKRGHGSAKYNILTKITASSIIRTIWTRYNINKIYKIKKLEKTSIVIRIQAIIYGDTNLQ